MKCMHFSSQILYSEVQFIPLVSVMSFWQVVYNMHATKLIMYNGGFSFGNITWYTVELYIFYILYKKNYIPK